MENTHDLLVGTLSIGIPSILAMSLTIFLASVVGSQRRCHAKFRDRA